MYRQAAVQAPRPPKTASLVFVVIFWNVWRSSILYSRLRQDGVVLLRKREGAHRHHSLSALQAVGDLYIADVSNSHFHLLLMGLVIGVENNYGRISLRAGQKRLGRNHDGVGDRLRNDLHLYVGP